MLGVVALSTTGCLAIAGSDGAVDPHSTAVYDVARDAFGKGQLREAFGKVKEALDVDSDNADAAYLGAVILLQFCAMDEESSDCHYADAEKYAQRALEAKADLRDARNTLGVIQIHRKRYDEAIATLKPLAEDILYASPELSWGNLGWAYLEKGNVDGAVDALRRSVAARPTFCVGNYRLGLAHEKKGDVALAHAAFTRAVETDRPQCQRLQEAFDARVRVALKLGKSEEALADLERCRELSVATPVGRRCEAKLKSMKPSHGG